MATYKLNMRSYLGENIVDILNSTQDTISVKV